MRSPADVARNLRSTGCEAAEQGPAGDGDGFLWENHRKTIIYLEFYGKFISILVKCHNFIGKP